MTFKNNDQRKAAFANMNKSKKTLSDSRIKHVNNDEISTKTDAIKTKNKMLQQNPNKKDSMPPYDMIREILRKTHDGNDLTVEDLKLTEMAANRELNEQGEVALYKLYENVKNGYKKPWFCGIENLTQDQNGFIYWKGVEVEHYDHDVWQSDGWQKRMKEDANELAQRCKILESRGIKPTTMTAIWNWKG